MLLCQPLPALGVWQQLTSPKGIILPPVEPHWTAYATPVIQFLTAAAAVWVAYRFGTIQAGIAKQQAATAVTAAQTAAAAAQTARNRLKYDLFERRLVLYDLIYGYIDVVVGTGTIEPKSDSEFLQAIRPLGWLTDAAVAKYVLQDLRDKMIALSALTRQVNAIPQPGEEHADLLRQHLVAQTQLYQEHDALAKAFEPYLKLEH